MNESKQTLSRRILPIVVLCLTGVPIVLAVYHSPMLIHSLTVESEGWGSMLFRSVAPVAAGYTLLFCVIPSALLCRSRWSSHLSRVTLYLSLGLLVIILLAWAGFEPLRRQLIFGR